MRKLLASFLSLSCFFLGATASHAAGMNPTLQRAILPFFG